MIFICIKYSTARLRHKVFRPSNTRSVMFWFLWQCQALAARTDTRRLKCRTVVLALALVAWSFSGKRGSMELNQDSETRTVGSELVVKQLVQVI